MVCHWRYVLDNLFGEVESVVCIGNTDIPERWDEQNKKYKATADDSAYATFRLKGGVIAHINMSWVTRVYRDDLVTFAIGCSFSFEEALLDGGIELRHMTCDCTVPMYRTSVQTNAAGPFHGPLVVSMRPMKPADAIRAVQITTRFPSVHGAPVHLGKPEMIGIKDLAKPDWGDAVPMHDDEIPVFWACGVTPQSVIMAVKPEFCITHYPGSMLVTDRRNTEFAIM